MCKEHSTTQKPEPIPPPSQYLAYSLGVVLVLILLPWKLSFLLLAGLIGYLVFRTHTILTAARADPLEKAQREGISLQSLPQEEQDMRNQIMEQSAMMAEHLAGAIRIQTVSFDDEVPDMVKETIEEGGGEEEHIEIERKNNTDTSKFLEIHTYLEKTFPTLHSHPNIERTIINKHSLIYHWKGSDPSRKPYLLMAHLDVVPVPDPEAWSQPPFAGKITEDGYIWGRGAIDDKHAVIGIMEALEFLAAKKNFAPKRSIYVSFGHDEETGGKRGARLIAEEFKQRGLKFEFVLDEGLFVLSNILPGHNAPLAMICVSEKGYVNVELQVDSAGGHSSSPPKQSAIGIMAGALSRVENKPMGAHLEKGADLLINAVAPGFAFPVCVVLCNLWLFAPLVKWILAINPATAPLVRTTSALTVFHAGLKVNVLPRKAVANINHRVHPGDTVAKVIAHDVAVINDKRVAVRPHDPLDPSPVTSHICPQFDALRSTVHEIFPGVRVTPAMMVGNTDTRYFWDLAEDKRIFRFNPIELDKTEVTMFHGVNERISVKAFAKFVNYYRRLILKVDDL